MSNLVFYVAVNGNDNWSGRMDNSNVTATDGPFATLHRARYAVRELKEQTKEETKEDMKEPVTIMVRGGRYYLEHTFALMEADGGTAQAPITYMAYPGEVPVISGGKRITNWKHYKDNIYMSEIPETRGGGLYFRDLYADGERQVRSRYPKQDPEADNWRGRWAKSRIDEKALESSYVEPYIIWDEPDAFQRSWSKPSQGELFLIPELYRWGDSCLIHIKSVDPEKGTIRLVHGIRNFNVAPGYLDTKKISHPEYCQFIIENLLEELTSPGEWCLDTEDGYVYYWPLKESTDDMEIVVPVLKRIIHMEGVSNVRISGFVFTETLGGEPSAHYSDVEGLGAQAPQMGWEYPGETIYMNRCKDCRIENNSIFNVGGNGIYLRNYNERNLIRRNEIANIGANGVVLAGGRYNIYEHKCLSNLGNTQGAPHPVFNEITDNSIHHIGLNDTFVAGIFLGLCNWNRITNNDIHDVPSHAINLGNSRYGRNYIEYNRITRAALVCYDTAAINCWHEMPREIEPPGHVIRYNYIYDIGNSDINGVGQSNLTMGIYLDNWSSNCIVYGNIIRDVSFALMVKGHNNLIENNIIINSSNNHIWISSHCSYSEHSTVIIRNIFFDTLSNNQPFFTLARREPLCRVILHCDNNLFYKNGERNPLIAKGEPEEFNEEGEKNPLISEGVHFTDWPSVYGRGEKVYDINSVIADPLFIDAISGNFELQQDSPALKLGFQPIDMNRIGIRK